MLNIHQIIIFRVKSDLTFQNPILRLISLSFSSILKIKKRFLKILNLKTKRRKTLLFVNSDRLFLSQRDMGWIQFCHKTDLIMLSIVLPADHRDTRGQYIAFHLHLFIRNNRSNLFTWKYISQNRSIRRHVTIKRQFHTTIHHKIIQIHRRSPQGAIGCHV